MPANININTEQLLLFLEGLVLQSLIAYVPVYMW